MVANDQSKRGKKTTDHNLIWKENKKKEEKIVCKEIKFITI